MSKKEKYKTISKRFDQEAQEGFNQVPGAQEFFDGLKNPFGQTKTQPEKLPGNKRFIVFEILVVIGLLFLLKFMRFGSDGKETAFSFEPKQEQPQAIINVDPDKVNEPQEIPVQLTNPVPVKKRVKMEPLAEKSFTRPMDADTFMVINNASPFISEPIIDTAAPAPAPAIYHYKDHRKKYRLRYVADLLVIDYSDSTRKPKLKPVLTGTPASFESDTVWAKVKDYYAQEHPETKKSNYLDRLGKGLKYFRNEEYKNALEVFSFILKENPKDQNALFYGALSLYEKEKYAKAMIMFDELAQVEEGIFEQDVDYYCALVWIKNGQTKKALDKLKLIASSDSFYKDKAKLLLDELK